jgi:tRNA(Ile)-lysidine synthase TilS/MesJ
MISICTYGGQPPERKRAMNRISKLIDVEVLAITTDAPKKLETPLQKFRRQNPRFDYYAMPGAAAAIERLHQRYPDASKRQVIDMLVEEGVNAFFPESNQNSSNSERE